VLCRIDDALLTISYCILNNDEQVKINELQSNIDSENVPKESTNQIKSVDLYDSNIVDYICFSSTRAHLVFSYFPFLSVSLSLSLSVNASRLVYFSSIKNKEKKKRSEAEKIYLRMPTSTTRLCLHYVNKTPSRVHFHLSMHPKRKSIIDLFEYSCAYTVVVFCYFSCSVFAFSFFFLLFFLYLSNILVLINNDVSHFSR
jgi:hypothetical protein